MSSPVTSQARDADLPEVRLLQGAEDDALWQSYVSQARGATVYHDLAWRRIFGDAFGYRAYPLIAVDRDCGKVAGVLPLFEVPGLLGPSRLVSVPFRDRGGVLYDTPAAFRALIGLADARRKELSAAFVQLKTIAPYPEEEVAHCGLVREDHWVRSLVELSALSEEALFKALGDKTRNMIRRAERSRLQFLEIAEPVLRLDDWLRLHGQSQRNLGLPSFPQVFFRRIFEHLRATRLFLVERQGEAVAGTIVFREAHHAIYAYSASAAAGRQLRANDFMLFNLMTWCIRSGIGSLDLGSDSPLQKSLLFFKRKWLAEQTAIPSYILGQKATETLDSSAARYNWARTIVRRVPGASAVVSPMIRFFG